MLSSQADEYTVTPDRRYDSSGLVRSGLRGFVRDIKMRSLRKKKLYPDNTNLFSEITSNKEADHNNHCSQINSNLCLGM